MSEMVFQGMTDAGQVVQVRKHDSGEHAGKYVFHLRDTTGTVHDTKADAKKEFDRLFQTWGSRTSCTPRSRNGVAERGTSAQK